MIRFSANHLLTTAKSFLLCCTFFFVIHKAQSQTTLAAGDIAFVGYITTDDGVNGTTQDDEFAFILLKDITTGTVIKFTDFGWLTAGGFQTANPCGPNTGAINDGIITWTAAANMSCGTEVRIRCKYTLQATAGTVSGTQACNNDPTAYLSLANGGDQLFAYQGTHASPTFIGGISINKAWDAALVNCFFSSNSSVLPAALASGANNVAVTGGINAKYNCAVTNDLPANVLAAINNTAYWGTDNTFTPPIPVAFQLPLNCNFSCTPGPNISPTVATGTITACQGTASANPNIQQFNVSGTFLTADILVSSPANFEVSTSVGSGYGSSLTLTQSGGTVALTAIYIRSAASAPAGPISGNVVLTSTGATTKNVAVLGTINSIPSTPTITPGGPTTFCSGGSVTLTSSSASGNQWYLDGNPIGGATNQTYPATASGNYTVIITLFGCTSAPSAATTVTVNPTPSTPTITPGGPTTFCAGGSVTLTSSSASGNQWYLDGNPIGGATNQTYPATASGNYTVIVTLLGCASAPSATTTVTVNPAPSTPTITPGGPTTFCAGGSVTLTSSSVSGNQWYLNGNPIGGATSQTYSANASGNYTVIVTLLGCASAPSAAITVTANPNPAAFTITGGGTFCPVGTTLSGPVDPNYTYQWGRSLFIAPFANMGTSQTQAVTASGNYQLVVTNQFGCSTSNTAVVNVADYVFNGSLGVGDPQQTGRINRFAVISTCAAPKACPGIFTAVGSRFYDSYTITNIRNTAVCATIGLNSGCGTNIFSVAYLGSFNPAAPCTNYLGDPGSSPSASIFYEVTIPALATIEIVVHEVNVGAGCGAYTLTVDVPRDLSPINAAPPSVVCNGTSTLTAPPANSYLWSLGGATTQSIVTPPLFVPTTFNITLGYGNAGCTRADEVTVGVTSLPPTVTCPGNITQSNTIGQCGRVVTYTTTVGGLPAPTVTYAFTGATTASGSGNGSGSFFNVGTTNVTVTVANVCGSSSCSFTVTINDIEPPTVTAGTISSCYPTVAAAQAAALAATSATDNCPGALVETASTVGTCSAVITVTTTDGAGNAASVTYNTRIDNTSPTVTVGTIASCFPTVAAAEAAALAATSATDNCPGALTETASTAGTCSAVITVTTTDGCGNATAVTYNTRIDNTAPTVTVGTIASCYPTVVAAEAAALAATSATDNCPGALTETASTAGTCSAVITVTTTDGCGNATAITYNTRIDNTPPVLTCPAPVSVSCASAVPAPNIGDVTGVSDNCTGVVTVTHQSDVISNQTCANRYTITRTYRATDGCGNFAECTQIITVNDQTPPTLTCPAPVTVSCAANVPAPNIASVTGVSDNCAGVVTVTHQGDVISNQTCPNRYTLTRTYRATDVCENFAECTQIITVNDQTPPTLTCPAPVTVSCAANVPAPNIASVTGVSDNCAGVVTVTHQGDVISNQTCANRYTLTRTYRATDVCGNFAECTQIITVNDQTPPVITCPGSITVSCASAVSAPNIALVTATDNCAGVVTITHISDVISNQTCTNRFTLTRTYRATDVCGNFSQCTQIITVNDQTAPVITCPANITVTTPVGSCTAVVNFTVTATDNCGTVTVVSVPASGSVFQLGTTTVISTATDACGNTSTCSFTVTVLDAQLPVITAQPANRTVCVGTTATFSVTAITSPNAGGQLNYQWQSWNGNSWVDINGATASTLSLSNISLSMNTNSYRVRIMGLCTMIISNFASLYVNPLPLVSISTSGSTIILPTQTVTLTAVVSLGGGTYQWLKNNVPTPGATSSTSGPLGVLDAGTYKVTYTDPNGCVNTSSEVVVKAQESSDIYVYPNPNAGQFHIRFYNTTAEEIMVLVYDYLGQKIFSRKYPVPLPSYSIVDVDLGKRLAIGSYLVMVLNEKNLRIGVKWISVGRE